MSTYLTKQERAALSRLPIAERRRALSERFAYECPSVELSTGTYDPAHPERFDAALSHELDLLEARIERSVSPPARIVQLIAPAVPMRVSYAIHDERGRHLGFDHQTPVLALALRADGTVSALTEHDVTAGGALTEYHPYPDVETGRAYYLDESTGEAAPTIHDTAAEMADIETIHAAARRAVAKLTPVKKAAGAK
jgi:hypothetical protein